MSYASGVDGVVTVAGTPSVDLDVIQWNAKKGSRLGETTNATGDGGSTWLGGVRDVTGSCDIVWDSTKTPESIGLTEGTNFTADFVIGNSALAYSGCTCIVESIEPKVNARSGEAVTYTLTFKNQGLWPNPA